MGNHPKRTTLELQITIADRLSDGLLHLLHPHH